MKKILMVLLLLLPVLSQASLKQGDEFPGIVLPVDGRAFDLQSQLGKVVLVHFWASWCDECERSIVAIEKLSEKFKGDSEQPVWVGINLDDSDSAYQNAIDDIDFNLISMRDPRARMSKKLKVPQLPYTLILDRDGMVRGVFKGFERRQVKEYEQQLRRWLDQH